MSAAARPWTLGRLLVNGCKSWRGRLAVGGVSTSSRGLSGLGVPNVWAQYLASGRRPYSSTLYVSVTPRQPPGSPLRVSYRHGGHV